MSFSTLVFSGYMPRGGIGGSYGGFIPSFLRNLHTIFQSDYQFTFPPTVQEHSLFFIPSPEFIVCRPFDDGHSDWYEVTLYCSFHLHFCNLHFLCFAKVFKFNLAPLIFLFIYITLGGGS